MNPPTQDYRASSDQSSRQQHPQVYPPPPQAIFPVPRRSNTENSSETSSSGSKRKRPVVDDSSDGGRPQTRASSTSDFNNTTKAQVRKQNKNKCWHCGAGPADICHVIGSRDDTFQDALRDGLIDFQEKHSPQNAIALCGTCHTNYDHLYNPSFFFLPTELNYFLDFERQDRKRRRRLGRRTGTIPGRMCPTAQTYQDHQIYQGMEGARSGGLYTRIVVNDFLSDYPGRPPFQPGLSEYGAIKSWTGSPMASLQRAVIMLRKLNLRGIPRDVRDALRQLQDAYSEELDLGDSDTGSPSSIEPSEADLVLEEERGPEKSSQAGTESQQSVPEQEFASGNTDQHHDENEPNIEQRRRNISESKDDGKEISEIVVPGAKLHHGANRTSEISSGSSRTWRWGPSTTSNDAAKFYRHMRTRGFM